MGIIDRHIAGRYLLNVIIIFMIVFSFVVAVDLFLNLDDFIGAASEMRPGAEGPELLLVTTFAVVDLWGPRLLQLFSYLTGVVLVVALGFTCAQFVRHREFIAVLASGQSLLRLARPMLLVAGLVTVVGLANQEFLIPRVASLLPRSQSDAGQRAIESFRVPLVRDGQNRLFYAAGFDAEENRMIHVSIWERDEQGGVTRRIWASEAHWDGVGWDLVNARAETPENPGEIATVERIETDLNPTVILVHQVHGYGASLSWREINRTLSTGDDVSPAIRERFDRIRYGRLSMAAGTLLAVVISLPFFLVRAPRSMVGQSLRCAPLAMAALAGSVLGAAAPLPGLPVAVGVFVPVLVLLPLAIWALTSIRT